MWQVGKYRYAAVIDGAGHAHGMARLLLSGTVILRVGSYFQVRGSCLLPELLPVLH
jgi:hypothetical protein